MLTLNFELVSTNATGVVADVENLGVHAVTEMVFAVLVPQIETAFTVMLPLTNVDVNVTVIESVPCPVKVAVDGTVQMYEVAPVTAAALYPATDEAQGVIVPATEAGTAVDFVTAKSLFALV